jgi:DNA polymerase III subunit delta'
MSFTRLIGNERNKVILQRLLERGNIASTFIFAGPDGVGKRQFALTLAKAANCQRAPADRYASDSCDDCPVCRRIDSATYGDAVTVEPDGQSIKIAQTRALTLEVYYRPREGRQRFFIIDGAERLRAEAANSLLKTLEEPPPTSTLILLSARPDALLPTIRSRAQRLTFAPLSLTEMENYLKENYPRPEAETKLLARLTEGRIGQATAFDLSVYREERRAMLGMIELMTSGDDLFRLLKAAEYLGKKEKDDFEKTLDLLASLQRDLLLAAAGGSRAAMTNIDIADRLEELAPRIGLQRLIDSVEKFDELRKQLKININRTIATEGALLESIEQR